MDVDVHTAKSDLSRLIRQAEAGEEVFITRRGLRVAQIAALKPSQPEFGTLSSNALRVDDRLLFAMSNEDAEAFLEGNY